jgi:hypothetical protein
VLVHTCGTIQGGDEDFWVSGEGVRGVLRKC